VKDLIVSPWSRRILASAAVTGALVVAALLLHPAPPAPSVIVTSHETLDAPHAPVRAVARGRRGRGATPVASGSVVVYVAGAVAHPGVYMLAANARAVDALARAGGATSDADLLRVNLAAHLSDGEEIAVLRRGEAAPSARRTAAPRRTPKRAKRRAVDAIAIEPLDLNSASADELADLPGLGPELAERIVEFRDVNGPFTSIDELADVSGMTPARLDRLTDRLTVR
jgi:competence protein ComEA